MNKAFCMAMKIKYRLLVQRKTKPATTAASRVPLSTFVTLFVACMALMQCKLTSAAKQGPAAASAGRGGRQTGPPHIVLVVADDVGWNDVGFRRGSLSDISTPNLDRLARSGVILNNYYVQPTCAPTRSQLLTGRYQIHTGFYYMSAVKRTGLSLNYTLLPAELRRRGYGTHLIGKWHLGHYRQEYLPTRRGFDSFFGFHTGSEDHFTKRRCERSFCGYDLWENENAYNESDANMYSTLLYTQRAVRTIRNHDKRKPIFLMLSYQAPHAPLQVPDAYLSRYKHIRDRERRLFAGMMTCLDEGVANITAALVDAGMWNNTVLIFTSDNGGQVIYGGSNWPLRGWKNTFYEGGIRATAFVAGERISGSGGGGRGRVSRDLLHVTDWYPTLLGLASRSGSTVARGDTRSVPLDGMDVWETLRGRRPSPRREILHDLTLESAAPPTSAGLFPTYPSGVERGMKTNVTKLTKAVLQQCKVEAGATLTAAAASEFTSDVVRAALRYNDWKLIVGSPGNVCRDDPPSQRSGACFGEGDDDGGGGGGGDRKSFRLFNVRRDPEERHDLSHVRPDVVACLYCKVLAWRSGAITRPRYLAVDPRADPNLRGGTWGPWPPRLPVTAASLVVSRVSSGSASLPALSDDISSAGQRRVTRPAVGRAPGVAAAG